MITSRFSTSTKAAMALALLSGILVPGCKDSETKAENVIKNQSTLSAHLVSDPSDAFRSINLHITQVEVKAKGEWLALASPDRVFDLQKDPGHEQALARQVRLKEAGYDQLRLKIDPRRSSVVLPDGTSRPLVLPDQLKDGITVKLTEGPASSDRVLDLILDLDAARSVHAGPDGTHVFAPWARLNDRHALGTLTGRLLNDQQRPLAGVEVMAQGGEEGEGRTLVRTVRTAADGTYRLDRLPVRRMYYVVAQPRSGETLYQAQASAGFRPTRWDRTRTLDFPPFQPAPAAPGIEGKVHLPLDPSQFQVIDLLQDLPTGERRGPFILRSAAVAGSGTYRFAPLPAGTYEVRLNRSPLATPEGAPRFTTARREAAETRAGGGDLAVMDMR